MIPDDLLYTKEHEWARIEGAEVTVGVTDFAQEQLGEVTFVELPGDGQEMGGPQEVLGVVESSKAASDINSPLPGKISTVNTKLKDAPELINQDCYGEGWICRLTLSAEPSTDHLMTAGDYENYLKGL